MANGIKIGSQEVWADFASNGLRFEFRRGGLQSLATYRGEDDVVPEASGREPGVWIADTRTVVLHGYVKGIAAPGSTAAQIRDSFRTRYNLILAVFVPSTLVTLTVYPPLFGLTSGTATLTHCRPMRITGPDPGEVAWYEAWEGQLEFECIKSPPNWVVA